MTDDDLVTAALDAEEAFRSRVRMFKVHKSRGHAVIVVEYPDDPDTPIDYSKPMDPAASVKHWEMGDNKMAHDFIRLQGWKAAVQKMLAR